MKLLGSVFTYKVTESMPNCLRKGGQRTCGLAPKFLRPAMEHYELLGPSSGSVLFDKKFRLFPCCFFPAFRSSVQIDTTVDLCVCSFHPR